MNAGDDLQTRWWKLEEKLIERFGKKPDLESILFLIGIQEVNGAGHTFTKEQKQDLMHIAICKVLSLAGYYELEGLDAQGWPHWKLVKKLPHFDLLEQEKLLKMHVIEYFEKEFEWQYTTTSLPQSFLS
jgi:hypothetical protein